MWNICARKLVGYSTAEVMGHSLVQEFITQDYQASVQAVLDQALAGVETANFEFPLITKAGARIEVLLNATTRRNEHGKVIGVVGIGQVRQLKSPKMVVTSRAVYVPLYCTNKMLICLTLFQMLNEYFPVLTLTGFTYFSALTSLHDWDDDDTLMFFSPRTLRLV